ncbi:hypothetical protein PMIN02_001325 [Paraphaeosphaeria minitans]
MEAIKHLVYSRQQATLEAAKGKGTRPPTFPIFDPPCECAECQLSHYSREAQKIDVFCYIGSFDNYQARLALGDFVRRTAEHRSFIKATIEAQGDTILRRWRNRSHAKRAALLLQVDPSLPKENYARVRLEYAPTSVSQHREKHRNVNLVPYLDVETLSMDPAMLIALLHNRAQFSPADWAPFDHQALTVAWGGGMFGVHFNKNCISMFGDSYGELIPWENEAAHRADIVGFPRGRLILEAQAYLMGFLRKLVESICSPELEQEESGAKNWTQYVEGGFKQSGATYWSNFTFGPFLAPPEFDIDQLSAKVKVRLDATADHLELLQTEPSYMRRYAKVNGDAGYQIISNEIMGDLVMHWFWLGVSEEFEHAKSMYRRYSNLICRGQALPKEFDDALGALEVLLVNTVHERSKQLQYLISQRPGFSRWYNHQPFDPKTKMAGYTLNATGDSGDAFREDPLWWVIMQLQGDPEDQTRFPYAMLFKYLDEHLASASKSERSRLDELLYDKLSDFATIIELLTAVRMHFPKCTIRNLNEITKTEHRFAWRQFKVQSQDRTTGYVFASTMKKFQKTPMPSGPRDGQWLAKLESSHAALQNFWSSVHAYYLGQNQKLGYSQRDIETLMRPIRTWKSAGYLALLSAKHDEVLHDIANRKSKTIPNDDV